MEEKPLPYSTKIGGKELEGFSIKKKKELQGE